MRVLTDFGAKLPVTTLPFGSEAGIFERSHIPSVVCGPGSIDQAHRLDEWIACAALEEADRFLSKSAHGHREPGPIESEIRSHLVERDSAVGTRAAGGGASAACSNGTTLRSMDFLTPVIAKVMFPADDATASLLLSVGAFGVGFLTRPLGALVFGVLADRKGRKLALLLSFGLMGAATFAIGVIPSFAPSASRRRCS